MSLARAFTTRRAKHSVDLKKDFSEGLLERSKTTRAAAGSVRNMISGPVQLVHTTNQLAYNAPDIFPHPKSATSTHSRSDEESDTNLTAASTPPTSPDTPFPEKRSSSPEPNHLSCYFTAPKQAMQGSIDAPAIPKRAPSHTKKTYDGLTRHRSVSRMSDHSTRTASTKASTTFSRASSTSTNASATSTPSGGLSRKPSVSLAASHVIVAPSPAAPKKESADGHPFGQELAQVSELVEEYRSEAPVVSVMDEEEMDLHRKGLRKFSPADYVREIQSLANSFLAEVRPAAAMWI